MKIATPDQNIQYYQDCRQDLERLLSCSVEGEVRPCPGCDIPCSCSGSKTCLCACSSQCEHLAVQMSSAGTQFPVEEEIVPLVYALNILQVCPPCWSCEGHNDAQGNLLRIPRVWFYCRSLVYCRLISEYLAFLESQKRTTSPWRIFLTHSAADFEPAFSIEPNLTFKQQPKLYSLRKDIAEISRGLVSWVRDKAQEELAQLYKTEGRSIL